MLKRTWARDRESDRSAALLPGGKRAIILLEPLAVAAAADDDADDDDAKDEGEGEGEDDDDEKDGDRDDDDGGVLFLRCCRGMDLRQSKFVSSSRAIFRRGTFQAWPAASSGWLGECWKPGPKSKRCTGNQVLSTRITAMADCVRLLTCLYRTGTRSPLGSAAKARSSAAAFGVGTLPTAWIKDPAAMPARRSM